METSEIITVEQKPEPTSSQLERARSMRRFNLLWVYLPIGLGAALILFLVGLLLVVSLQPDNGDARSTISGVADAFIILTIIPLLLLCGSVPTLAVFITIKARENDMAPLRQTQLLFWRIERLQGLLGNRLSELSVKVAQPFIAINGVAAYMRSLLNQLKRLLKRS